MNRSCTLHELLLLLLFLFLLLLLPKVGRDWRVERIATAVVAAHILLRSSGMKRCSRRYSHELHAHCWEHIAQREHWTSLRNAGSTQRQIEGEISLFEPRQYIGSWELTLPVALRVSVEPHHLSRTHYRRRLRARFGERRCSRSRQIERPSRRRSSLHVCRHRRECALFNRWMSNVFLSKNVITTDTVVHGIRESVIDLLLVVRRDL